MFCASTAPAVSIRAVSGLPGHPRPTILGELSGDAVILDTYASAVERGFSGLGKEELEHYLSTAPYPVERVEAKLVIDKIPDGNPRAW